MILEEWDPKYSSWTQCFLLPLLALTRQLSSTSAKASCWWLWEKGSAQLVSQGMAAGLAACITDIVPTLPLQREIKIPQQTSNPESINLITKSQEIIITVFYSELANLITITFKAKLVKKREESLLSAHTENVVVWHKNRNKNLT